MLNLQENLFSFKVRSTFLMVYLESFVKKILFLAASSGQRLESKEGLSRQKEIL